MCYRVSGALRECVSGAATAYRGSRGRVVRQYWYWCYCGRGCNYLSPVGAVCQLMLSRTHPLLGLA